jgi:hypothetical protein
MIVRFFMYVIAALCGVMNCWHAVGGFVAACAYAWRGKASRTGFWVMGAGYGLLSGFLLLDAANGGIGPKMQPLYFPIPATVALWVVPAIGAVMTAGMLWASARARSPQANASLLPHQHGEQPLLVVQPVLRLREDE